MTTMEATEQARTKAPLSVSGRTSDETKLSLKTTEFWAIVSIIGAILVASAVSDSLGDVRAWTLVAAVGIGYMISRGLAKSGHRVRRRRRPAPPQQPLDARYRVCARGVPAPSAFPITPTPSSLQFARPPSDTPTL